MKHHPNASLLPTVLSCLPYYKPSYHILIHILILISYTTKNAAPIAARAATAPARPIFLPAAAPVKVACLSVAVLVPVGPTGIFMGGAAFVKKVFVWKVLVPFL